MRVLKWIILVVAALFFLPWLFRTVGLLFTLAIAVIAIALVAGIGHRSRRDDTMNTHTTNRNLRTEFAEDEFHERELHNYRDRDRNKYDDHNHF